MKLGIKLLLAILIFPLMGFAAGYNGELSTLATGNFSDISNDGSIYYEKSGSRCRESEDETTPSKTKRFQGYYNFTYDDEKGTITLEVKQEDLYKEFLYVHALSTGLGSNDIGLDRGQLGDGVVVKWIKSGNKLLLLQPNQNYRASSTNPAEQKSVEQAFARSVLAGFDITKTTDGVFHIDITPFLIRDAHGVARRLKSRKQGSYKLDKNRSVLWMENTRAFPKNNEFEALLTFTGVASGNEVRSIAPDASSLSVIQHHSFVELPDNKYQPRKFHPRSGSFYTSYHDYSTPIGEPMHKRLITRHRLEKKNPEKMKSEAIEPIIYYLDPGTPEPVRSALLEGARWWNQAFETAGFVDAFQVKMLPDNADPMDLRYNMIQWVHRSTRGWSYGGSITDPRTGEILKGHVSLGSLRIRQDYLLAQGIIKDPFKNGTSPEMLKMALARIRQLSAHEVGHTLGFAHNFAASTQDRASVMDYPHPKYEVIDNKISLDNAYTTGIGAWDKLIVQYAYGSPAGNETEDSYLDRILKQADQNQLPFISDRDARDPAGAHATAHLWDNGKLAAVELAHILEVRQLAMKNFSPENVSGGTVLSEFEDLFVPIYFMHRYQVEAAVKAVGGITYNYATTDHIEYEYLSQEDQLQSLNTILNTLDIDQLKLPLELLKIFPPRSYGYSRNRESFKSDVGVAFDPIAAATTNAHFTLDLLLNSTRMTRISQQQIYGDNLSLDDMLNKITRKIFSETSNNEYSQLIQASLKELYLTKLLALNYSKRININVKEAITEELEKLRTKFLNSQDNTDIVLLNYIKEAEAHPERIMELKTLQIPDGSPIGSCGM
ncbi:MAG: zinc-dependent metalloprotease [Nonlabens sp.]